MSTTTPANAATRRERIAVQLSAVGEALGVTLLGAVVGVVAVVGLSALFYGAGLTDSTAAGLVQSRAIQVGFLATALGYVAVRGNRDAYVKLRRPTPRDVAWMVASVAAIFAFDAATAPLLADLGLNVGGTGHVTANPLASRPLLWPLFVVLAYGFAAPAEELLYRGVVQGRLRRSFGPAAAVVLAALLFGLMHVPIAALSRGLSPLGQFVAAVPGGLVWGLAYERTDNLLVPAWAHAFLWSQPLVVAVAGYLGV